MPLCSSGRMYRHERGYSLWNTAPRAEGLHTLFIMVKTGGTQTCIYVSHHLQFCTMKIASFPDKTHGDISNHKANIFLTRVLALRSETTDGQMQMGGTSLLAIHN